jgi:hypothetical protein
MQIQHSGRVKAFVEQLKAEHLTQSDPSTQARVLELAGKYFDEPAIVESKTGERPMSRRELGLVPDGVITNPFHPDTAGAVKESEPEAAVSEAEQPVAESVSENA